MIWWPNTSQLIQGLGNVKALSNSWKKRTKSADSVRNQLKSDFIFWCFFDKLRLRDPSSIGHGNQDHETTLKKGGLRRFTTWLSNPDLDRLLDKALQAPSTGWGCVIPIAAPYFKINGETTNLLQNNNKNIPTTFDLLLQLCIIISHLFINFVHCLKYIQILVLKSWCFRISCKRAPKKAITF